MCSPDGGGFTGAVDVFSCRCPKCGGGIQSSRRLLELSASMFCNGAASCWKGGVPLVPIFVETALLNSRFSSAVTEPSPAPRWGEPCGRGLSNVRPSALVLDIALRLVGTLSVCIFARAMADFRGRRTVRPLISKPSACKSVLFEFRLIMKAPNYRVPTGGGACEYT